METQIQIKINKEDKEIIKEASKRLALGYSTFCRQASIKEARRILEDSK